MEGGRSNSDPLRALEALGDPFLTPAPHGLPPSPLANRGNRNTVRERVGVPAASSHPFITAGSGFVHNGGGMFHPLMQTLAGNPTSNQPLVSITTGRANEDAKLVKLLDTVHLEVAMTDPKASRVFQDEVGRCSGPLKEFILETLLHGHVPLLRVCCNRYGSRSVQKLFGYLETSELRCSAAKTLSTGVTSLFTDSNGKHVIAFCLDNFSAEENESIFKEICQHLLEIATNQAGCSMLMKYIGANGSYGNVLLIIPAKNSAELAFNPNGNYLVQKLFDVNISWVTKYLLWCLRGRFYDLSTDQFGSHVIQKCLTCSSQEQFANIAHELIGSPNFTDLFAHPYGNYAIQSMLSAAKYGGPVYNYLKAMIEKQQENLHCSPYGRNVLKQLRAASKQRTRSASIDRR